MTHTPSSVLAHTQLGAGHQARCLLTSTSPALRLLLVGYWLDHGWITAGYSSPCLLKLALPAEGRPRLVKVARRPTPAQVLAQR
jgi:hypothetical protein